MSPWRLATLSDDREIIAMCHELNREDPGPKPVPDAHMARTLERLRSEPKRGCAIVLSFQGRIEGYALLISFWSNELGGEVCNIDELYVKPACRSQGFASLLVSELIRNNALWPALPVAVELEVTPQNSRARALYSKLGFEPTRNALMRLRF